MTRALELRIISTRIKWHAHLGTNDPRLQKEPLGNDKRQLKSNMTGLGIFRPTTDPVALEKRAWCVRRWL